MDTQLCLLVCHNFIREIQASITAEGWPDVTAATFPVHCGRPPLHWQTLRPLLPTPCSHAIILGGPCLASLGDPPADWPPMQKQQQEQCFHLVTARGLVAEALADGAYLITPAWLANWPERLKEMGVTTETTAPFFKEFARQLVLLDTGLHPEAPAWLEALAHATGLPARRLAVGLDHCRLLLSRLVLEWRLATRHHQNREQERHHARELADHISAMDLLARLANTRQETEVITTLEELFRMLFAPAIWHYVPAERGQPVPDPAIAADLLAAMVNLTTPWGWTPSGEGFMLRLVSGDHLLGWLAIDRLAFPQYRERYLNLALAMNGVCGLAIENARSRKRLLEAEKMASLGTMVAGVAHEINTPLGVGLAASSTLQAQSTWLTQRFADQAMTRSELENYLAAALAATRLIQTNLERIGQLIDTFRQVAVQGKTLEKSRFRLRNCLDNVLASLGNRLPMEQITVVIQCDPGLEIDSYPGDWASIFTNLLTNSLRHAFKGRPHGHIDILATTHNGQLMVDYADNGWGLAAGAMPRLFDPFFTTDLQHGMGLGLHLVYNLITHRFGGGITCHSQPGEGVRFHIEVPL